METATMLIFWYGMLHAFGADHLVVMANVTLGRAWRQTIATTLAFAVGHGMMLFLCAKLLAVLPIPAAVTEMGDVIASMVIMGMGFWMVYSVATGKIEALLTTPGRATAWSMGALMGIGGVRGMLVTLALLGGNATGFATVLAFVAGVSVVFVLFGLGMGVANASLGMPHRMRMAVGGAGLVSLAVGASILF